VNPYDDPHVSAGEIADYLASLPHPLIKPFPMPELLPCPFCGAVPELLPSHNHGFIVSCEHLHCPINPELTFSADTEDQAAERWNQRATPSPQAATASC
jgi:hypothetical protein